jgi:hypothetical protein
MGRSHDIIDGMHHEATIRLVNLQSSHMIIVMIMMFTNYAKTFHAHASLLCILST